MFNGPVCFKPAEIVCRCPLRDCKCENGHEWHSCLVHGKVVLGPSDHSKDTFVCHCEDKA